MRGQLPASRARLPAVTATCFHNIMATVRRRQLRVCGLNAEGFEGDCRGLLPRSNAAPPLSPRFTPDSCMLACASCSRGDMMCESCCCYACAPPSAMPLRARIHCHPFLTTTAATSSSKATPTRFSVCGTRVTSCHVTVSHIIASHVTLLYHMSHYCVTCHITASHVT